MKKQTVALKMSADLQFAPIVRSFCSDLFASVGFSKLWCDRLKLVCDELFMNAVQYGSTQDSSVIALSFTLSDSEVTFCIEDDGTGPKATTPEALREKIMTNRNNTDVAKTSGRGLAMITDLWTDRFEIGQSSLGGISVSFSKKVETGAPPKMPSPSTASAVSNSNEPPKNPASFTVALPAIIDHSVIDDLNSTIDKKMNELPADSTLLLDFKDVNYVNSVFIGQLASWHNQASHHRINLSLIHANAQIKDVLTLVGLNSILSIN